MPEFIADAITTFYQAIRAVHAATVSNSVPQLTGRSARSYREFVEANQHEVLQD